MNRTSEHKDPQCRIQASLGTISVAMDSAFDGRELAALHISGPDSSGHVKHAAEMVGRCNVLLLELEEFQSYLKKKKMDSIVDLRGFRSDVGTELKRMNAVRDLPSSPHLRMRLRYTNFHILAGSCHQELERGLGAHAEPGTESSSSCPTNAGFFYINLIYCH